jgi:alpha-tubulin suppressor-like RCC1 family protein
LTEDPNVVSWRTFAQSTSAINEPMASVQSILMSRSVACATVDGELRCWGSNANEVIGSSARHTTGIVLTPVSIATGVEQAAVSESTICHSGTHPLTCTRDPTEQAAAANLSGIRALSLNTNGLCALDTSGRLFCGGNNSTSILDPFDDSMNANAPLAQVASDVQSISISDSHACGEVAGTLQCWGGNNSGEVGNGDESLGRVIQGRAHVAF